MRSKAIDRSSGAKHGPVLGVVLASAWAAFLIGCASVEVTGREPYEGEPIPRPNRILVRDFAATVEDLPAWSDAAKEAVVPTVRSEQDEAMGRELGARMAGDLVVRIRKMGLGAERMTPDEEPSSGDLVLVGQLISVERGDRAKRMVIGFGAGAAELSALLEGYLATEEGLVKVGSGRARSAGSRGPGVAVPIATTVATANPLSLIIGLPVKVVGEATGRNSVEGVGRRIVDRIAEELEQRFKAQGWLDVDR